MSARIEELKAQHAKALGEAIRQETIKEAVMAEMPAFIAVKSFSPHVAYADYSVTVEPVADLSAALEVAEKLNPIALFKVKDSCLAFLPETFLDKYLEKNPRATSECIGAYVYKIEGIYGQKEEKFLECFVELAGYTIRFQIPVISDPDTYRTFRRVDYRGGYRLEDVRLVNKSGHFLRQAKWWSTPEHPSNFTLY